MVCFVSSRKPLSMQATHKRIYQQNLMTDFSSYAPLYPEIPLQNELYSKLIYIYSRDCDIDVDNMSKPFIDAFRTVIYTDDCIINHRICSKIHLSDYDTIEINIDMLPDKIISTLDKMIQTGENHILYFEVGDFSANMVRIGE